MLARVTAEKQRLATKARHSGLYSYVSPANSMLTPAFKNPISAHVPVFESNKAPKLVA